MSHRWVDQFEQDMDDAAHHQQELEAQQYAEEQMDPNDDIDTENGQCICGRYDCPQEYIHWSSGF